MTVATDVRIYGPTGDLISVVDTVKSNVSTDQLLAAAGDVNMGLHKLINLLDGTNPTDAATLEQLTAVGARSAAGSEDYLIYYDGTNWQARNNSLGTNEFTSSDFATVFNQASIRCSAYGLSFTHTIHGQTCYYAFPQAPTHGAPTAGGSIDAGDHYYVVCAVNAAGYVSMPSRSATNTATLTKGVTIGANQTVTLTLPQAPAGTTALRVYRTLSNTTGSGGTAGPALTAYRDPEPSELYYCGQVTVGITSGTTTYVDTASDASLVATNVQVADDFSTVSDGGAIRIMRPSGLTTGGVLGSIPQTQTLQMYPGLAVMGNGRATRLVAQPSMQYRIGVMQTNLNDNTTLTVDVTEDGGVTIPALPFVMHMDANTNHNPESFLVTSRTLVSGTRYTYTVKRSFGSRPDAHTGTGTRICYVSEYGAGRIGAMIDAYNCDRVRIDSVSLDLNNIGASANLANGAWFGILQKRTKLSETGGAHSTSLVMFNEVVNVKGGCGMMVGKPYDISATANTWLLMNRIEGGGGSYSLAHYIGDGHLRYNNFVTGGVLIDGGSVQFTQNHVVGNSVDAVTITNGTTILINGNYFDNIKNGVRAVYKPAVNPYDGGALSASSDVDIIANKVNAGGATAGQDIFRADTACQRWNIIGNMLSAQTGVYLVYPSALGWVVDDNTANAAITTTNPGAPNLPIVGLNAWGNTLSINSLTQLGTHAVRPAATGVQAGSRYIETDTLTEWYSDGSIWVAVPSSPTGGLAAANNLSDVVSAATSRTNLGLGSVATHPLSDLLQAANNLSDLASAATARTNLGLGTAAVAALTSLLQAANNLSDLGSAATARTNLGLGAMAVRAAPKIEVWPANPDLVRITDAGQLAATALTPVFYFVKAPPGGLLSLTALLVKCTVLLNPSTAGAAVYSVALTGSNAFTATLVAMMNADADTSTSGNKLVAVTTGAFGSGAGTASLDFTANYYMVGAMVSSNATLKLASNAISSGGSLGAYVWNTTARASVHDWPSPTFTNTSVNAGATLIAVDLYTSDGQLLK